MISDRQRIPQQLYCALDGDKHIVIIGIRINDRYIVHYRGNVYYCLLDSDIIGINDMNHNDKSHS